MIPLAVHLDEAPLYILTNGRAQQVGLNTNVDLPAPPNDYVSLYAVRFRIMTAAGGSGRCPIISVTRDGSTVMFLAINSGQAASTTWNYQSVPGSPSTMTTAVVYLFPAPVFIGYPGDLWRIATVNGAAADSIDTIWLQWRLYNHK